MKYRFLIQALFALLVSVAAGSATADDGIPPAAPPPNIDAAQAGREARRAAERRILEKLHEKSALTSDDMTLPEFLEFFGEQTRLQVVTDSGPFTKDILESKEKVKVKLQDVQYRSILEHALRQFELTWTVRDEVLTILSAEDAETQRTVRAYDLHDLMGPTAGRRAPDADTMIESITSTVAPETWDTVGGQGSITAFDEEPILIISQTYAVHEDIADLFYQLRAVHRLVAPR